jgi:aminopeptidase YwaD
LEEQHRGSDLSPARAQLAARLRQHVQQLAATPRPPGSPGHAHAAHWIRRHWQQAGYRVRIEEHQFNDISCRNLLTEPEPADEQRPLLVLAAHYDSVAHSPGADDNASGVAVLLEAARQVRPALITGRSWQVRVQWVAYDLEEWGMLGSWLHSSQLHRQGTPLWGMLALEMVGYTDCQPGSQLLPPAWEHHYPHVGNFLGVVANQSSQVLLDHVLRALRQVPDLPVEFLCLPDTGASLPVARLSDHSPFWDHGYPALMLTDTAFFRNPHYHQPSDTPDTLDYSFLARVTEGVIALVQQLQQPVTSSGEPAHPHPSC